LATVAASAALEELIASQIGATSYSMWFSGHTRLTIRDRQVTIGVPNRHFQEYLSKKFGSAVEAATREICGPGYAVKFVIDPELFRAARTAQEEAKAIVAAEQKQKAAADFVLPPVPRRPSYNTAKKKKSAAAGPTLFPNPGQDSNHSHRRWRDLKHFVTGPCNRVAHAAAVSVVEDPAQGANPLTIFGTVGTGKTHLLEGIYGGLRRRFNGWLVRYVTAEDFTNRFVLAMKHGKLNGFRRWFRDCDCLLLDNLHFLAGKKSTIEEFKHTFDVLIAAGKQIVVTTDCHPRLAEDLHPEVADRLLGGTVWGLQPPDAKTRLEILRAKAGEKPPTIPDDVLHDLAQRLRGNVRELEGAVNNLRHYAKLEGQPISRALAAEALGDLLRHAAKIVSLEDIDAAVCKTMKLKPGALQSEVRSWSVSHPRMVAVFLARKHTSASYSEIGRHFGGRNHSTAVANEKKVRQWLEEDAVLTGGTKACKVREIIEAAERLLNV
jgi:chromosomal replication initiator protein